MNYEDVLKNARDLMGPHCRVCPECNGLACKGEVPGLGGVGSGESFMEAVRFLKSVKVLMDVVYDSKEKDTSIELFGKKFDMPVFMAPIGGMNLNYNGYFEESEYLKIIVPAMIKSGSLAFLPNGAIDKMYYDQLPLVKENGGLAIPTIKPWGKEKLIKMIHDAEEAGAIAVAVDIDSCGHPNLKLAGSKVEAYSPETLTEIIESINIPFIAKGIMTKDAAIRCRDAGCYGIVVSNHGGRVLDFSPAPASRLIEIKEALGDSMKIFVDGGIRSGMDVYKCLALGADAVLIGRPYVTAVYGGKEEGIKLYNQKILDELKNTMFMTACNSLDDINMDKIVF